MVRSGQRRITCSVGHGVGAVGPVEPVCPLGPVAPLGPVEPPVPVGPACAKILVGRSNDTAAIAAASATTTAKRAGTWGREL